MYGERDSAHELAKASLGLSERKMRTGRTWLLEEEEEKEEEEEEKESGIMIFGPHSCCL